MILTVLSSIAAIPFCLSSIISTQFHAQDGLGSYSYGYSGGPSSKLEYSANGVVAGTYAYIDGNGVVQTASYTADAENGFRVQASNLPEVHNSSKDSRSLPISTYVLGTKSLIVPVTDTPEVTAAKIAHLAAVEHQKQIIASHPYRKRLPTQRRLRQPNSPI